MPILLKGCEGLSPLCSSIVTQGANEYMLDEVDRSVHDALCSVSRALENTYVCPGGGAVETALSVYLEDFARTLGSREQLAIAAFAEALLVIPRTLAVNAALDSSDLTARLRAIHAKAQGQIGSSGGAGGSSGSGGSGGASANQGASSNAGSSSSSSDASPDDLKWYGLDLVAGKPRNNMQAGVIEAAVSKTKALRFATEAAVTILRIDDLIKIAPEPEREPER